MSNTAKDWSSESEIPNPKQIRISNDSRLETARQRTVFRLLERWCFGFVSDFGFRISDLTLSCFRAAVSCIRPHFRGVRTSKSVRQPSLVGTLAASRSLIIVGSFVGGWQAIPVHR